MREFSLIPAVRPVLRPAVRPPLTKGGGFSLASLFRAGEDGFLFYPALASFLFQDTAAATPVAANNDPTARFNDQSGKGRNATQATTTKRPLWKDNSGKPYLAFDGSDDSLNSAFIPTANLTLAVAARLTKGAGTQIIMGGGATTGNKRAYIGMSSTGVILAGWGAGIGDGTATDRSGQDVVVIMTGDGTGRDLWINGTQVTIAAPTGAPDGTGGGVALGAFSDNGSIGSFAAVTFYAGLALNRRATPSEIAGITSLFQRTYQ